MEFQFQKQQKGEILAKKNHSLKQQYKPSNNSSNTRKNKKFVGVRQRPSGKWVAEIKNTTQKIRMWLGTYDTAEEAARAYDEAAFLLRGSKTRTNFVQSVSSSGSRNNPISLKIMNLLNRKRGLSQDNPQPKKGPNAAASSKDNCSSNSSSSDCSSTAVSLCANTVDAFDLDDLYKPDFENCFGQFHLGSSQLDQTTNKFDNDQNELMGKDVELLLSEPTDALWDLPSLYQLFFNT